MKPCLTLIIPGILLLNCFITTGDAGTVGTPRPVYPSGLAPGTRVVLLVDEPVAGPGLEAGMAGTVLCAEADDGTGSLLISWDLWHGGTDDESRCLMSPVGLYPAGSAVWVDPAQVMLGKPFDGTGILQEDPEGCLYLEADDGGVFYLVGGMEFMARWWVVRPGSYVRVRGLLNTSRTDRPCPQQDGDIYHPIIAPIDWTGKSCCDKFVCGFNYGDRVVLVGEANPHGAVDLPRGASGTIICCTSAKDRSVLVSWNLWSNGDPNDTYLECSERVTGLYPPNSTWLVSVEDIAKWFQTECGVLKEIEFCDGDECLDLDAVGLLVKNRDLYYLPDVSSEWPVPDGEFRAMGLHTPYAQVPEGEVILSDGDIRHPLSGTILHSVVMPCSVPSCCQPPYNAGDRVMLVVDEPGGAEGLLTGATGTVMCCNPSDPLTPIFVSWDGWANGNNDDASCAERPLWYPDDSGWWMACAELERLVLPDLYDAGEASRRFSPEKVILGEAGQEVQIGGMIGNRGGRRSDPFYVEIYASTDDEIGRDDYLFGLVAMDLDADALVEFLWKSGLPAGLPAGTYHIGWLIDPDDNVREMNEENNTAVIESGQLTVVSE